MMLRARLPNVCADHGRPAVEFRNGAAGFYASGDQFGVRSALKYGETMNKGYARPRFRDLRNIPRLGIKKALRGRPVASEAVVVHGEWPLCSSCRRRARICRCIGYLLVVCAALTLAALIVARQRDMEQLLLPLVFAILPGWIPIGLLLTVAAFDRSTTHVRARITNDKRHLVIQAHPDFATAVDQKAESERQQRG
jgi:hypothetical protein